MSDANIPIIGVPIGAPNVTNLTLMAATIPDLLSEIERRGVNLPETSFQLVQQLCANRNARWNASNGAKGIVEHGDNGFGTLMAEVWEGGGEKDVPLAVFYGPDALERANEFNNPQFTPFERAAEVAGEVGELVNAVKKLRRRDMKMPGNYKPGEADRDELLRKAAYEIGDVFVTAFNLCGKLNVDAWNCLQMAFNTKSKEMNFPEVL